MDLFTEDQTNTQTPEIDQQKDYLSELVGEGKTYRDAAALARAVAEKETFIQRLKNETAGMRNTLREKDEELRARMKLEEAIDKIANSNTQSLNNQNNQHDEQDRGTSVNPTEIETLVERKLNEVITNSKKAENFQKVSTKLKEQWGDMYPSKLKEAAQTLNLDTKFLNELAQTAPEAFYKLVGAEDKKTETQQFQQPRSSMNTAGMTAQAPKGDKGWAYFEDMRKKDSARYWTPAVQNELHAKAQEYQSRGLDFYTT